LPAWSFEPIAEETHENWRAINLRKPENCAVKNKLEKIASHEKRETHLIERGHIEKKTNMTSEPHA